MNVWENTRVESTHNCPASDNSDIYGRVVLEFQIINLKFSTRSAKTRLAFHGRSNLTRRWRKRASWIYRRVRYVILRESKVSQRRRTHTMTQYSNMFNMSTITNCWYNEILMISAFECVLFRM